MTLYVMASAISTMLPAATPIFTELGSLMGYMIPIMINITMFSLMIGLVKLLLR